MIPEYVEYLVEYDLANNTVYVSGMDKDDFWYEIYVETDIAEPESYAWGYAEALKSQGKYAEVENITE